MEAIREELAIHVENILQGQLLTKSIDKFHASLHTQLVKLPGWFVKTYINHPCTPE